MKGLRCAKSAAQQTSLFSVFQCLICLSKFVTFIQGLSRGVIYLHWQVLYSFWTWATCLQMTLSLVLSVSVWFCPILSVSVWICLTLYIFASSAVVFYNLWNIRNNFYIFITFKEGKGKTYLPYLNIPTSPQSNAWTETKSKGS